MADSCRRLYAHFGDEVKVGAAPWSAALFPCQTWRILERDDGSVEIINADSGNRLFAQAIDIDVSGCSWDVGVDVAPPSGAVSPDQTWTLEPHRNGTFKIVNAHSGRSLFAQKRETWLDGVGAAPANRSAVYPDQFWVVL